MILFACRDFSRKTLAMSIAKLKFEKTSLKFGENKSKIYMKNLIKKRLQHRKILKDTFFYRTPPAAASVITVFKVKVIIYRSSFQNCTDSLHVTVRITLSA